MDLRKLFDTHRVRWKDRGANCAKGHINIPCPFCKNDPSYHLSINEETLEYYCFRNPKHCGRNPSWLFHCLHIDKNAYSALNLKEAPRTWVPDTRNYEGLGYFDSAEDSEEVLKYLESRLFSTPLEICKQFNLKVSKEGEWAGRLIIPLTVGWTGRSMRSHINLRYKAHTSEDGFFLYRHNTSSIIILEGAIDAMRVASVTNQFDVAAKCGNRLSPALLSYLKDSNYLSIWNCPDGTVPFSQHNFETATLRSYCTQSDVNWLKMNEGVKDFGETDETSARQMLSMLGNVNHLPDSVRINEVERRLN